MRRIEKTTQFKRDFKREKKGKHRDILETVFVEVLVVLANDHELLEKYRDHAFLPRILTASVYRYLSLE